MTILSVISNTMRLQEGIRDNMDGTTTYELHEMSHVVHFDIQKRVDEDVNKDQEDDVYGSKRGWNQRKLLGSPHNFYWMQEKQVKEKVFKRRGDAFREISSYYYTIMHTYTHTNNNVT